MDSLKGCKFYEDGSNMDEPFQIACPTKPMEPKMKGYPKAPDKWDTKFRSQRSLLTRIFKELREKAIAEADLLYQNAYKCWEEDCNNTILFNESLRIEYKRDMDSFRNNVAVWDMKKAEHIKKQDGALRP